MIQLHEVSESGSTAEQGLSEVLVSGEEELAGSCFNVALQGGAYSAVPVARNVWLSLEDAAALPVHLSLYNLDDGRLPLRVMSYIPYGATDHEVAAADGLEDLGVVAGSAGSSAGGALFLQ